MAVYVRQVISCWTRIYALCLSTGEMLHSSDRALIALIGDKSRADYTKFIDLDNDINLNHDNHDQIV
jgi:hypothetical protein